MTTIQFKDSETRELLDLKSDLERQIATMRMVREYVDANITNWSKSIEGIDSELRERG